MDKNIWNNICNMEDYFITYLLYREGKSIEAISIIRRKTKAEVEKEIIKSKLALKNNIESKDKLVEIISLPKNQRLSYIRNLTEAEKANLEEEIYKRYISFKNPEDRMILIWLIGELKSKKLLPFLKMELSSNNVNYRRLSCSALGKIKNVDTKEWLEDMISDENPQVRQYAIKALSHIGDDKTIEKLKYIAIKEKKAYLRRNALESIEIIQKRLEL
ncbi:HEAT repeat domain-containing protein [Anaerosalibacter sp. Marseille-P3206]|uniref:HEAT repeat domain-containing protein n=1 Tax=Anaerosalibacter sp. Marseille-P3206 TaxID=1871005 RepID=UPI0009874FAF|nr:HEAT repeat domain-containing protein [Anaerosalibacter sp. Marseille-P3206]